MVEKKQEDTLIKADKPGVGTIISSALYMVTVIMVMAYLYQSLSSQF